MSQAAKDKRVKAVVCWAPAVFFRPLWAKKWTNAILKKGFTSNVWGFKFTKKLLETDFKYDNNLKEARKIKVPVQIIHGTKDAAVPLSQSKELYKNLNCEKELIALKGANHIFSGEGELEKAISSTKEFFGKHI